MYLCSPFKAFKFTDSNSNLRVQRMEIIMLITTNQEAPQERLLCKNDYYIDVNFLLSADKYETMKYLPLKLPMTV